MQAYIKSCLKPNVDMVLVLIIIEAMKTNFFFMWVTRPMLLNLILTVYQMEFTLL